MTTGTLEDIIDLGGPYTMIAMREWSTIESFQESGLEITEKGGCHVKFIVKRHGSGNEWVDIVVFNNTTSDLTELYLSSPKSMAKEIMTDQNLKKMLSNKFYNFLYELNEDYVKVKMV